MHKKLLTLVTIVALLLSMFAGIVLADQQRGGARALSTTTITSSGHAQVNGWDVTLDTVELTANQAQDITLVVKGEGGKSINNAGIEIEDYQTYLPGAANIQNGVYTFKDVEFTSVGTKAVKVYQMGQLRADLKLNVVAQHAYEVTTPVATLLQGQAEDIELTVAQDGVPITPGRVQWFYEDGSSDAAYPSYLSEGISSVRINATQAGALLLRVENNDGTLYGEARLTVVAPKLSLLDKHTANLTNNIKTRVHFQVVDPRNNNVLTDDLEIMPLYLSGLDIYAAKGEVSGMTIKGATRHALTILPRAAAADQATAAQNDQDVALAFKINGIQIEGSFTVQDATITSDPGVVFIGLKNNLTLTYQDANNKPIVGKDIVVYDTIIGQTDQSGQLIYPVSMVVGSSVEVAASTDVATATVPLSIGLAFDTEAPQVAYKVVDDKATFLITDNIRISHIHIDGQEVGCWPSATYEFTRTLKPGVNNIHIQALDSNANFLDEIIQIEHKAPEPIIKAEHTTTNSKSVVLQANQIRRQDGIVYVQARQFEKLGAQYGWQAGPKVATLTLGRSRVEVISGSLIGKVNGAAVMIPGAPFLANDSIYVPLRFVSEALGVKVHTAANGVITITLD